MRRGLSAGIAVVWMLAVLAWSSTAWAQNCTNAEVPSMSVSSMNAGNYNPFTTFTPVIVTVIVQTTRSCALALTFSRGSLPAIMSSGAFTVQYQVEAVGGGASYLTSTLPPAAGNRLNFLAPAAGFHTVQVHLRVLAGQVVNAATYSDTGLTARIYNIRTIGNPQQRRSVTVTPQATVVRTCSLGVASPSSLSFSAAEIPQGLPNPAIVKSTTLSAACTAPTFLRLTGSALTPSPAIPLASGFDNFINYRAVASFGAATTTLNSTTTPATSVSAARNVASGPTTTGTVNVDVNLLTGQSVSAGSYSGVLTVTIDPNL